MAISYPDYFKNWLTQIQKSPVKSFVKRQKTLVRHVYGSPCHNNEFDPTPLVTGKFYNPVYLPHLIIGSIKNGALSLIDKYVIYKYKKSIPADQHQYLPLILPTPMGAQILKGIVNVTIGAAEIAAFLVAATVGSMVDACCCYEQPSAKVAPAPRHSAPVQMIFVDAAPAVAARSSAQVISRLSQHPANAAALASPSVASDHPVIANESKSTSAVEPYEANSLLASPVVAKNNHEINRPRGARPAIATYVAPPPLASPPVIGSDHKDMLNLNRPESISDHVPYVTKPSR